MLRDKMKRKLLALGFGVHKEETGSSLPAVGIQLDGIKEETVGYAFNVEVEVKPQVAPEVAEQIEVLSDASESEAGAAIAAAVSARATESQEAQEGPTIHAAGLGPSRPDHMEYSAPDESGGIMQGEMDADEDLYAAVFGESIFNDAIGIVMY